MNHVRTRKVEGGEGGVILLQGFFLMFKVNGWPHGRVSAMVARHND